MFPRWAKRLRRWQLNRFMKKCFNEDKNRIRNSECDKCDIKRNCLRKEKAGML